MSFLRTWAAPALAGVATLAGVAAFTPSGRAAPIAFENHVDYSAGRFSLRVILADMNGDGYRDIVTANPDAFTEPFEVSVLLNLGDGTFGPAAPYPTGAPGRSVDTGDLDGDGDQDLAVGLQSGDFRVAILINDSQGHFAPPIFLAPLPGRPDAVAVLDLDGDSDTDILLAQAAGEEVVVLRNQGGGNFDLPASQGGMTDAYFVHLAVGDVDADGDPDLAFSRSLSSVPPSLFRNRGDGTFEPRQSLEAKTFEYAGTDFGDLDGDGDLDLVLVSENGSRVLALRNGGSGSFDVFGVFPSGVETQLGNKVTVADLDGDGLDDAIVPAANTNSLATLRSASEAGFDAAAFHELGGQPTDVAAADLDGDGDLDLAGALPYSDKVSVLLNLSAATSAVGGTQSNMAPFFGPAHSNPTHSGTSIPFVLGEVSHVRISVLDVAGRNVRSLFGGERPAGRQVVTWDGRNDVGARVAAGVYLIELDGGGWRRTARVVVVP